MCSSVGVVIIVRRYSGLRERERDSNITYVSSTCPACSIDPSRKNRGRTLSAFP